MIRPRSRVLVGLWRGGWQHRRDVLFSLGDLDRAVERGKFDFGSSVVHRAKEAFRQAAARRGHVMAVRNYRRLIDDVPIKRSSSDVKGIGAGEAHLDGAAVVLQYINPAVHKTAVEEDISGRGLHAHVIHGWL